MHFTFAEKKNNNNTNLGSSRRMGTVESEFFLTSSAEGGIEIVGIIGGTVLRGEAQNEYMSAKENSPIPGKDEKGICACKDINEPPALRPFKSDFFAPPGAVLLLFLRKCSRFTTNEALKTVQGKVK